MENQETDKLDSVIASLMITMKHEFVPQKFSRNFDNKHSSLNWVLWLSCGLFNMRVEYSQGIGHIPNFDNMDKQTQRFNELNSPTTGTYRKRVDNFLESPDSIRVTPPNLKDILYSLVIDSDVLNYEDFEDWANCDKKIYEACIFQTKAFIRLIGRANIQELVELFQDY